MVWSRATECVSFSGGIFSKCSVSQEILSACWAYDLRDRPPFTQLADMLEKLPKLNRRLSHPGHFWKSAEYVSNN